MPPWANSSREVGDSASDPSATSRGPQASSVGPACILTALGHLYPGSGLAGVQATPCLGSPGRFRPGASCPRSHLGVGGADSGSASPTRFSAALFPALLCPGWPRGQASPPIPSAIPGSTGSRLPRGPGDQGARGQRRPRYSPSRTWYRGRTSLISSTWRVLIVSFLSSREGRKEMRARSTVPRGSPPLLGRSTPPCLRDEPKRRRLSLTPSSFPPSARIPAIGLGEGTLSTSSSYTKG